jgi:hypothetical protein
MEMDEVLRDHPIPAIREWYQEKGLQFNKRQLHKIYDKNKSKKSPIWWLRQLNEEWCVIIDGGKTRVMRFVNHKINHQKRLIPEFLSFGDFRNFYLNENVTISHAERKSDYLPVGNWWLKNRQRRQYKGLIFDPTGEAEMGDKLNLWHGFAIEPKKGDWSLMQQHIC